MPLLGIAIGTLFFLFGAMCGWFLGLAGFIESAKLSDIRQSYRVRNLQYLVGGLVLAFLGDYKKFGFNDEYVFVPVLCFAFGALPSFLITVLQTQASIRRSVRAFNTQREPSYHLDVEALLREFKQAGKPAFDKKLASDMAAVKEREEKAGVDNLPARRKRHVQANMAVSKCIYGVLHYDPAAATALDRERLIDAILDAGCAVVGAHSRRPDDVDLVGSFMRFVADASVSANMRAEAFFTFDGKDRKAADKGRYFGYLELTRGAGHSAGARVVLPVESANTKAGWTLPGAPLAARHLSFDIMNVRPLKRTNGIPDPVWDAMATFFGDKPFTSVASVVVLGKDGLHGVLNIESSKPDLLGEDRYAAEVACAALQPVASLLSKLD